MSEGGDQTPISRLEAQVEVSDGDTEATLSGLRNQMRQTDQQAEQMGRSVGQMGEKMGGAVDEIKKVTDALKEEERTLQALKDLNAGATARGGPGIPQVEEAIKQSEEKVGGLKKALADLGGEAQHSTEQIKAGFLATVSSVDDLRTHIQALQQVQRRGAAEGVITPGLDQEINRSKSLLKTLDDDTRATTRNMSQNFLATATSIDQIRQRLQALMEMRARGLGAGIRTPDLDEEIKRTVSVLKSAESPLDEHGKRVGGLSVQYGLARSAVATMSAEIQRMGGVSVPGLSQVEGVAAGLAEKFIGVGGAASIAVFGITALGVAAATSGTVLTVLGSQVQDATAHIATSANITVQAAHDQEVAFRSLRSGGIDTAEAYANVAGMLATYNGQALTTAQATKFMADAQDGATATGQRLGQVTEGFARALVSTHTPLSQSHELMNVLYVTSLNTGVSIDQLGLSAARMVERTGQAAPGVRDLGIALTLAAQAGAQGQEGLEPVDNLIRNLANNSPRAANDLEGLGVVVAKNARGGLDLAQTLLNLKTGYEGLGNDAQRYALAQELAGQGAPVLQAMLKLTREDIMNIIKAYDDHNRVSKDAETRTQTLGGMVGRLGVQAKDTASSMGEELAGSLVLDGQVLDVLGTKLHEGIVAWDRWAAARRQALGRESGEGSAVGGDWGAVMDRIEANKAAATAQQSAIEAAYSQAGIRPGRNFPGIDIESLQHQQETLSSLTSEAQRLHLAMVATTDPKITPGGQDQRHAINEYLAALTQVEEGIRRAYDPSKPEETTNRLARLKALSDEYDAAVQSLSKTSSDADRNRAQGIQVQIDLLNQQINAEDHEHSQRQKDAAFQKQQAADLARQQREAREADPLLGISQGLQKDREELIGTAGQVMGDLNKAVELKGQQGARAAGEAFANEARKWGEELEKAGVENWQESFNRLIDLGRVAIVTGSPQIKADIHDLLAGGEEEIRDSNIGHAMADAMAKANAQMLEQQSKIDDQLLRAQTTGADARAQALQQEVDREYDVWSGRQIDKLELTDRNEREIQRIREQWGREDVDRAQERARARADLEENANRAARDKARDQARALTDLTEQQARAQTDNTRHRQREDADALFEHQKRIKEIQRRGGDPAEVAKAITEENYSYQESLKDKTRSRAEDDAEAAIKRAEAVADAQKRQAEQVADANRKAGEQAADLAKRQGEQDSDLGKTRQRQLTARVEQQADSEWLRDRRIAHEQEFFQDAESKASQRFQNELSRIDARYQHEEARSAAASEQIALKREHDLAAAQIKADERFHRITPEESTTRQNDLDLQFAQATTAISTRLRQNERNIDLALAQQIAGRSKYAPGFSPQNVPYEQTPAYVPPTPSFGKGAFSASDSLFATNEGMAKSWMLNFMGQQPSSEPLPVILPDEQVQEIIDGVGNLPPMEMDGEVVESGASRIRRNRNLARTVG